MPSQPPPLNEFGLIARYLAPLATHPGADGLRDDVCVLAEGSIDGDLVITTDAVVAGVHLLADEEPATVAERALRTNLSDLAAKGAKPLGYQLTLALNPEQGEPWIAAFCEGLRANQQAFNWSLLGGDTVRTPGPTTISVTALGTVPTGSARRRSGGEAGDEVWVTGWIGDGALGLAVAQDRAPALSEALAKAAEAKFRLPEPRVAFGQALAASGLANASADVSDGLIADIGHIATASGLGALIDAAAVPLSDAGRAAVGADAEWLSRMLTGGDDYEIVFTTKPEAAAMIERIAEQTKTAVARIGCLCTEPGVKVEGPDGQPLAIEHTGYSHF